MAVIDTGYLTYEELRAAQTVPGEARYARGPVAVVECVQEIPCNPCEASCAQGAIVVGAPITSLPRLDGEKCVGCAVCAARCPGLAIFIVDKSRGGVAEVTFPYEYLPLPGKGDDVTAANRAGEAICAATVTRVINPASFDRTPLVTIEVPAEFADEARDIVRRAEG
jgi:Fe-S-cluster-containing hydrogenase component 2